MNNDIIRNICAKKQANLKEEEVYSMDSYLKSYIDNNIIREYINNTPQGYSLDISELSSHDRETLSGLLYEHDPYVKELIEDRMQALIDSRKDEVEAEDTAALYRENGYRSYKDGTNGETMWIKRY